MATIERTAYPRLSKVLAAGDLEACYTPLPEELEWVRRSTRGERPRLGLLVLFKIFHHVRVAAGIGVDVQFGYDTQSSPTSFRHYAAIRDYLGVTPYYGSDANAIATRAAHTAALAMDQPVDIINATIDEFIAQNIELPAFSTLDRIAEQIHAKTQTRLLRRVARRLTDGRKRRSIEN
ncbi:transposase [Burkholderia sp. MSMB1552]|nr:MULTISPECIES: DUF4158 domain-containing protein [unclassified Burkholderia]KVN17123.1 transposase [Burkholderia sp. MSMB1552]KWZ50860.1 transposase [Burkholderia sp. MSMB1588]